MPPNIFTGIKAVVEGHTFAHTVIIELHPRFCLRILLLTDVAALRTITNLEGSILISDVVFRHSCLPISMFPFVSSPSNNQVNPTCDFKLWMYPDSKTTKVIGQSMDCLMFQNQNC